MIDITIICKDCGDELDGEIVDYGNNTYDIKVEPCETCITNALPDELDRG